MHSRTLAALFFFAVSALGGLAARAAHGAAAPAAAEILEATGVRAGVCVHLDCGDGGFLADLARGGKFLAHGLCSDPATASSARRRLASEGLLGLGNVEALAGGRLPYADNLVNLLVAEDYPKLEGQGLSIAEIVRVLCPNGAACLGLAPEQQQALEKQLPPPSVAKARFEQKGKFWLVLEKRRPEGLDDWTHWNHAPDGNLVSRDTVLERPNQIQWIAGEHWENCHGLFVPGAGVPSGVRSANGRNYYIMSGLVARDAFNGVMLWHRRIKDLPSHLVIAADNEVYVCRDNELVALDGLTGNELRSCGKVADCHSLLFVDGLLLSFEGQALRAFEAASGKLKWSSPDGAGGGNPLSAGGKIFCMRGNLICLELATGKLLWKRDTREFGNPVFAFGDKLLFGVSGSRFTALSAHDGSVAWAHACQKPAAGGVDPYFADGLVWVESFDKREDRKTDGFHNPKGGESYKWEGLDPATGQVRRSFLAPVMLSFRCHPIYATERFLIGNRPMYFTDWRDASVTRFEATRMACGSSCGLGQGMFFGLYTRSNMCMCVRHALSGISAFTSDHKTIDGAVREEAGRLEKGAAPAAAPAPEAVAQAPGADWPMYRADMRRSACGMGSFPTALNVLWKRALLPQPPEDAAPAAAAAILRNDWIINKVAGDPITQPAVAEGKVFVSLTHAQQVIALDEKTGELAWTFPVAGRLDTPPTIHRGMCLLGCHDGWVYGLRADNGQLVWRFRAAPAEKRIVAYGEVESSWPVVGGVLLVGETAYVCAGRTTETDGGLYVHALDIRTGQPLWSERRVKPDDGPIGAWNLRGLESTYFGPSDLLCSDGKSVAISGHSRGHFDCKDGGNISERSFGGPHFGWMQSRYSSDNQHMDYPPRAYYLRQVACPAAAREAAGRQATRSIAMGGKPGWKVELPAGSIVEALAATGDSVAGKAPQAVPCPAVRVKAVSPAPQIDGVIDDAYLQNATPLVFSMLDGTKAKPKEATTGFVLADRENLYLAFRCEKADTEHMVVNKTQHDDDVWQDECIEMFLDPLNTREKKYFHLIVNPAGVTQDARVSDLSWNPAWTAKCGKEQGKAWIAEVKIPFKEFGLPAGQIGHVWSVNFNRSARDAATQACEDIAWSPTYCASSHVPECYGYLWLDALAGGRDEAAYARWLKSIGHGEEPAKAAAVEPKSAGGAVVAAVSRGKTGSVLVLAAGDGARVAAQELPAAPAFEGLALAHGKVFVTLQDGTVMCLGDNK